MRTKAITAGLAFFVATAVSAQSGLNRSQEREVIEVITGVGGTCERVVRTQTIGQLDNRDTLMAVACDGGEHEQYVLIVDQRANMTWYATCEALAIANNNLIRCFT